MEIKKSRISTIQNINTMAYRNLLKTLHNPDHLMDVLIQPVMFMILFGYLFGGAIAGGVHAYLPIIVPGILIQTILSAASGSGTQIKEDMETGIFDRFKTLPIAHIAPLAGQLLADILRLVLAIVAYNRIPHGVATKCSIWMDHCHHINHCLYWLGYIMDLCIYRIDGKKRNYGRKHFFNDHATIIIFVKCFHSNQYFA